MKHSLLLASTLTLTLACGSTSEDGEASGEPGDTTTFVAAPGVRIDGVAVYQGPKRTVMIGGQQPPSEVPIIAGRDTVFRVFYSTSGDYDGQPITGRLEIEGGDPIEVTVPVLAPGSVEGDMATTVNFGVPGVRIGDTLRYSVGLLQDRDPTHENPIARYPANGLDTVPVDGRQNKLRIVLVPFRYDADGSQRLPDTSPEQVDKIRQRIRALYPVSDVEITVHDPVPLASPIGATGGSGWQSVGIQLVTLRSREGATDDVYYYAIFNPANTIYQYCGNGGCVLGLTLLNNDPPSTGSARLRGGMGVGFPEFVADTAAHEIGHSHGRGHAPCAPGGQIDGVDRSYPHSGGVIGEWAYDITKGALIAPDRTDIMGYCQNQFVSDYTYIALHRRSQNVNLPSFIGEPLTYDVVAVDGAGNTEWGDPIERTVPYDGVEVTVRARVRDGSHDVPARFLPWDHLPGGLLFVPRLVGKPERLEATVGGVRAVARR